MSERWKGYVVLGALCFACGGEVRTGEPAPPGPGGSTSGGSATGSKSPDTTPTVDLPECVRGFLQSEAPGKPCHFITEGRCYDEKLAACGCACKGQTGLTCSSGFPDPNGTTEVLCY